MLGIAAFGGILLGYALLTQPTVFAWGLPQALFRFLNNFIYREIPPDLIRATLTALKNTKQNYKSILQLFLNM